MTHGAAARAGRATILLVDDEENVLLTISTILGDEGYDVATAASGREAVNLLRSRPFDLVLTDLSMKDVDGLDVLASVREHQPASVAIMLTGYASLESSIEAIRRGAYDYLMKPTNTEELLQTIERGLEKRRLQLELKRRHDELQLLHRLVNIGVDAILHSTRDMAQALERIAAIVAELLAPADGVLFLWGGEVDEAAEGAAHTKTDAARAALAAPETRALAREAVRAREPRQARGPERSILAVPIHWRERPLGAMVVHDPQARTWSEEQIQAAATVALRAALAIDNANLYRSVLEEKETLRLILNAAGDGIVGIDGLGRIALFSRAAERLTGRREAELRDRPVADLEAPQARGDALAAIRERAAGSKEGLASGEARVRGASGAPIDCDVVCCEVQGGRGDVRSVLALRDARERRRADEVRTAAISHLTHELKTPLTSMLAYAYLLGTEKLGPLVERQAQAVKVMRRNGQNLLALIENMLASAQIAQGTARYRFERTSVASLFAELRDCFGPVAVEREVGFAAAGWEGEVEADRDMLLMAVNNLVSNALKFTDAGGSVRVEASDLGERVRIEVHDTGPGIAPEDHDRIFQRHFQAERSRGGSGLGLSIVKSVVDAHGGQLRLESRPGEGAHFFIELPKLRGAPAAEAPAEAAAQPAATT